MDGSVLKVLSEAGRCANDFYDGVLLGGFMVCFSFLPKGFNDLGFLGMALGRLDLHGVVISVVIGTRSSYYIGYFNAEPRCITRHDAVRRKSADS